METKLLTLLLLLSLSLVRSLNPSLNDDVLGLIVFKADLQDPKGKLASWNEDDDTPCNWEGVKCNPRTNRVTEISLNGFSLSGRIGRGLLQLQFLRKLSLSKNNLTGSVSPQLMRLQNLRIIDLSENHLSGEITDDFFRQCGSLGAVSLANNKLTGKIPTSLSSCSSIFALNFSSNQFSGSLPSELWSLNGLRSLDLSSNDLEGVISEEISTMNNLREIDLSKNRLSGRIPDGIGSCLLLRTINFGQNSISGNLPETMQKLSLCKNLILNKNALQGEIPTWIGEMGSLESLDLSGNKFSGLIPESVGKLRLLKLLSFSSNGLSGSLPETMVSLANLMALDLSRNSLTGDLPQWIFRLSLLQVLDLSRNTFSGEIRPGIGGLRALQVLDLSTNSLIGRITSTIGELKDLSVLDLSHNQLNGSIPQEIGKDASLKELRLEMNLLTGKIPTSIQHCSLLRSLILSENKLSGPIPVEIARLTNLQNVDLSYNDLTGTLPKKLSNLENINSFNISHNHLQGELPSGGFFNTISPHSVSGNPFLCGSAVNKSCPAVLPKPIVLNPNSTSESSSGVIPTSLAHRGIILSISALIAIGAAAVIVIGVIAITVLNLHVRSLASPSAAPLTLSDGDGFSCSPTTDANSGKLVMFSGDPDFSTGAHALLNKDCELGRGGFGAVYKTVLQDGRPIAIKKLTVSSLVKSQQDFEKEIKKLGKIRHPNIVSLEGYYWTQSLQLLIYEFISGGSLYKLLHENENGNGNSLTWNARFNIILGIARSLAFLHQSSIIHYNIKSSNVLVDEVSLEAKVADFGLARLLPMLDRYVLSSKIQSALGYMAPEFACRTVKITEKCDVYGFGVLVLEIIAGKKPVEYMEDDVSVLCDVIRESLEQGNVEECVDSRMQGKFPSEEAIPVVKLGLICTSQVPSNRPDMVEVVKILELIRCPMDSPDDSGSS